jgi:hypothetical protein
MCSSRLRAQLNFLSPFHSSLTRGSWLDYTAHMRLVNFSLNFHLEFRFDILVSAALEPYQVPLLGVVQEVPPLTEFTNLKNGIYLLNALLFGRII